MRIRRARQIPAARGAIAGAAASVMCDDDDASAAPAGRRPRICPGMVRGKKPGLINRGTEDGDQRMQFLVKKTCTKKSEREGVT